MAHFMSRLSGAEIIDFISKPLFNGTQILRKNPSFPRITVVTPSYNQATFLERTILSVLNQNYPNFEYIVIDGGSTDGSVAIIKKYEKYLSYWQSERDRGQSDAINKGFAKSSGEILAYINSDDIYLPNVFSNIAGLFHKHPEFDIIYGHTYITDENDVIRRYSFALPYRVHEYFCGVFSVPQQSSFWKRKVYEKVGGFNINNRSCMDGEFYARAAALGFKFMNLNRFFACFRIHSASITGSGRFKDEYHRDHVRMAKDIMRWDGDEGQGLLAYFYKIKYLFFKFYYLASKGP